MFNDNNKQRWATFAILAVLLIVIVIIIIAVVAGKEAYHGSTHKTILFSEQTPRRGVFCDEGSANYRDAVNNDYLYRAYQSNTSPYAYDNTRFCTSHYFNTCGNRRSGSRAANMGKWQPIVMT